MAKFYKNVFLINIYIKLIIAIYNVDKNCNIDTKFDKIIILMIFFFLSSWKFKIFKIIS